MIPTVIPDAVQLPQEAEALQRIGDIERVEKIVYRTPTKQMKQLPISGIDFLDMCDEISSGAIPKKVFEKWNITNFQWACLENMEPFRSIIATAKKAAAIAIEGQLLEEISDITGDNLVNSEGDLTPAMVSWQKQRHSILVGRLKSVSPEYGGDGKGNTVNISIGGDVTTENMTIDQLLALPIGEMKKASEL